VLEGIEVIMFRTIGDGPALWESLLPPEVLRLPEELARVDALLDDPAFFAPFAPHFHPVLGRPKHRPAFRRAVKWRTGSEGRISALKRQYGWDRTRLDSTEGARTWAGYGILAHNLVKISTLAS
jgi:hypothetical protein